MRRLPLETLRKWPTAFMSDRYCVKPYTIQPVKPNEKSIEIDVGTVIMLPFYAFHMDPKYFPNPEKFDPERFSDENRDNINPNAYMPFGVGPRNCIGSRFAILENKVMFFHLLAKFDIVVVKKTQVPLVLTKVLFILLPVNGFWLGLKARNM